MHHSFAKILYSEHNALTVDGRILDSITSRTKRRSGAHDLPLGRTNLPDSVPKSRTISCK